jgi:hypothetical protein
MSVPGYEELVEFGVLTSFAYPLEDGSGAGRAVPAAALLWECCGSCLSCVSFHYIHGEGGDRLEASSGGRAGSLRTCGARVARRQRSLGLPQNFQCSSLEACPFFKLATPRTLLPRPQARLLWPPPVPRQCWATRRWRCTPRTRGAPPCTGLPYCFCGLWISRCPEAAGSLSLSQAPCFHPAAGEALPLAWPSILPSHSSVPILPFFPPRYAHLHGKYVVHPVNGRRIPIICDSELVDMSFGTGGCHCSHCCGTSCCGAFCELDTAWGCFGGAQHCSWTARPLGNALCAALHPSLPGLP